MSGIFISFRDQDEPGFAVLLHRELGRRFGFPEIFHASTAIRAGDDFEARLLEGVLAAQVLLAVVGARWLTTPGPAGGRAIDSPADWVRREIATAFARGACVIPILVNDAERLTHADLPGDVDRLRRSQYLRLRHDDLDHDLERIVAELEPRLPARTALG
jgi:hypothetical protein